jgi:hypothetical protein
LQRALLPNPSFGPIAVDKSSRKTSNPAHPHSHSTRQSIHPVHTPTKSSAYPSPPTPAPAYSAFPLDASLGQVTRQNFLRRRSSFPPSGTPTATTTPDRFMDAPSNSVRDFVSSETSGMNVPAWLTGSEWDGSLNITTQGKVHLNGHGQPMSSVSTPMARLPTDPPMNHTLPRHPYSAPPSAAFPNAFASSSKSQLEPTPSDRSAHVGADLAWRTILSSVVDVEGVGQVGIARVLSEIWKRGGGEAVSLGCQRQVWF